MDKTELFLGHYRTYESLLREQGTDYKTVEERADDKTMNRMRITRQMRNYLTHNADPAFLAVSDEQIKMLEQFILEEQQKGDLLKEHLYRPKQCACEENSPLEDVLKQMGKRKASWLPVYEGERLQGLVNIHQVVRLFLKNPKGCLTRKEYGPYGKISLCFSANTPMDEIMEQIPYRIPEQPVCCTKDGTMAGKFMGILKENG